MLHMSGLRRWRHCGAAQRILIDRGCLDLLTVNNTLNLPGCRTRLAGVLVWPAARVSGNPPSLDAPSAQSGYGSAGSVRVSLAPGWVAQGAAGFG